MLRPLNSLLSSTIYFPRTHNLHISPPSLSSRRMKHPSAQPFGSLDRLTRYRIWKEQHVPLLYDWLSSRKLVWPHEALRWGYLSEDGTQGRNFSSTSSQYTTRALFLAERTGSSKRDPNTLLHFDVKIVQELSNKPQDVAKPWLDEAVVTERVDQMSTRDFWLRKRIIHPGEVNRIRLAGPNIVVTHTDNPFLFVWDIAAQPDRKQDDMVPSTPTCTLVGHNGSADYALDVAWPSAESDKADDAWVVSGGSDCQVLVWRLKDYQTKGQNINCFVHFPGGPGLSPRDGHSQVVEDVSFSSVDRNLIASVGRDSVMMLWDIRRPIRPISAVQKAHDGDINCCDWGGTDAHRIATGGSDGLVRIWDRRFLKNSMGEKKPTRTVRGHSDQVTNVMWNRYVPHLCASGGEDGHVLIWNMSETDRRPPTTSSMYPASHELIFRHVGHTLSESKVVDLEWLPSESDPYCIGSLSATGEGGSTMQMWRISDMIYRPREEVAADLRQHARSRVQ